MIKVSVFYPSEGGKRFDMDYYCKKHIPMVRDRLGAACNGIAIDKGLGGDGPDKAPPFVAAAHLFFDSVESFENAFNPHGEEIMGDIPNYTDRQPLIQVSEVIVNARGEEIGDMHVHKG